jgi:hypothetical protein
MIAIRAGWGTWRLKCIPRADWRRLLYGCANLGLKVGSVLWLERGYPHAGRIRDLRGGGSASYVNVCRGWAPPCPDRTTH